MRSAVAIVVFVAGCAVGPVHVHRGAGALDHPEYLVHALTSDSHSREAMWQAAAKEPPGEDAALRRALLRSVPGHSGYDMAAAETELQNLLANSPSADVAPLARARLEDLRAAAACRQEVEGLKRRLSKVADIERRMNEDRR